MKIATWNLERPTSSAKRNVQIIQELEKIDADIVILTESNDCLEFRNLQQHFHSSALPEPYYKSGERRVSIYTKYECINDFPTFRPDTSICKVLQTPIGNLAVYGTVVGIYGNRQPCFEKDLREQINDIANISKHSNICIGGDLNMSFTDNYYYAKIGREIMESTFKENGLNILTGEIPQNIDHIILPSNLLIGKEVKIRTWNADKKLSDHIGVAIELL